MEDVFYGFGVQVGSGGDAALVDDLELRRECVDGLGDAFPSGAAQFEEIVGCRDGDQQAAIFAQDAAKFGRVHACGDGEKQRERTIGEGDKAISVGDDPLARGIAAGGGIDGRDGDIDAVREAAGFGREAGGIEAFSAAGIEKKIVGVGRGEIGDGSEERLSHAAIVESAARGDGGLGIAGLAGSAVLRLEEIDVAAAREVEGMSLRTDETAVFACQRAMAIADGAYYFHLMELF